MMRSSTRSPPSQNASNRDDESESTTALPHIGTNHDGSRIILNLDVRAKRNECVFPRYPKWVIAFLQKKTNEPEDAWVVLTFLECFLLVVVPGVMLFFVEPNEKKKTRRSFWYGLVWFVITRALFLQRFTLALHYHTHVNAVRAKKSEHFKRCLNAIPTFVIAPFFGIPAGIYWYHHNAMHHVHGNAAYADLSSTERSRRDSAFDFFKYWMRFLFLAPIELSMNMLKYRGLVDAVRCYSNVAGSFAAWWYLNANVNASAANWTLAYTHVIASLGLMFGNWSQHIFVCPDDPRNDYKSTYTCINSFENQKTFDDGYHVQHHVDSRMHWSTFASNFSRKETLEKHAKEDALVFEGVHFFDVGLCVMLGKLDYLAERYVFYGQKKRTKEEIVMELKRRLEPIEYDIKRR